ncbi:hypothetical protein L2K70_11735 [Nocardioides KLBMP 9356]|uniref:Alpha-L-rhamnosidase n=1 Tax=Nocardioides potassii TaxID=2911371 RepID=A0ABS9HDG2_9ACTN|nr:alpha-L-rhamnosidase C-terminal domain-containing protein [Nocardioides potassii]MCF6378275.1 hypothetical protein [Nocardioides potassii]
MPGTLIGSPLVAAAQAAPDDAAWHAEVLGNGATTLYPAVVTTTFGGVTNADRLVGETPGSATLTWDGQGLAPTVILDYGRVVNGLPFLEATSVTPATGSTSVGVRAAYSESLDFLLRKGSTRLVLTAPAGAANLKVDSVANFVRGQDLTVGTGAAAQTVQISAVGTAATVNPAFAPVPAGATRVEVSSVAGYTVGNDLYLGEGADREKVTIASVGRASFATVLATPATAGATNIKVEGNGQQCYEGFGCFGQAAFQVGDQLVLDGETVTVTSVGTPGANGTGIGVTALASAHANAAPVEFHGPGIGFTPAASRSFPKGAPVMTPGTGLTLSSPLTAAQDLGSSVTGSPGNVVGDSVQFAGTGTASARNRTTNVSAPGRFTTPANQLQGGVRFHALTLTTPGTIEISAAGIDSKFPNYDADDYAGWFLSNDEQLNDMWYSGAYTLDTNMAPAGVQPGSTIGVVLDGAKRDRRIWIGDLLPQGRTTYAAFGYGALGSDYMRNSIKVFGDSENANGSVNGDSGNWTSTPPVSGFYSTSYSMYHVLNLVDYFRHSGDRPFAIDQYDEVKNQLGWNATLENDDGLVVTTAGNDGRDWDYYDGGKPGAVASTNIVYYRALSEAAWLAQSLANGATGAQRVSWQADADAWSAKAARTRTAINNRLFDQARGVYRLSTVDNGTHSGSATAQDANALAVLYGVVDPTKAAGVLGFLRDNLRGEEGPQPFTADANYSSLVSPFVTGFETAARFESGDADEAIDLMHNVWDKMVDRDNPFYSGALWENFSPDGTIKDSNTSLAHGWATGPTWQLSTYVLGVQPVDPGYKTWRVKPTSGGLEWSKGQVPTPQGPIEVSWSRDGKAYELEVTAPDGASGEVWVPLGTENATSAATTPGATLRRREPGYDVYAVDAGTFTFTSKPGATPVPPTTGPPTTVPPTTVPPVTLPPQAAGKVRVKDKVRAGKMLKIRGRDLSATKVSITLGGKKLGTAKVEDGRFAVTRKVPKNLSGKAVLRVLDRSGDVLVRTTVKVLRRKAA